MSDERALRHVVLFGFVATATDADVAVVVHRFVALRDLVRGIEAFEWGRRLAKEEGIVAGISSGANACAAAIVAAWPEFRGKRIVTIMCSLGERYLSTYLFEGLEEGSDDEWLATL